jgi:competence protein CoiA
MLSARRKSDGQIVTAYFSTKAHGPFSCAQCGDPVILKTGRGRTSHFAHENPIACKFAEGESELHRRCKVEIFLALQKSPGVSKLALERPLGTNRPDVSAEINGVPVAIEVQISSLSLETIAQRTMEYARKGIYVLWLLQWAPSLDARRYTPRLWEKWIHAAYFGRVYYWTQGLNVVSYHFDPHFKSVPKTSWYSPKGKKITAGGFSRRSKRFRMPIRGRTFNLATDFGPRNRDWSEGEDITIPAAKLYVDQQRNSVAAEYSEG